jgi:glucose/arabinose dehydrogenase
MRSTPYFLAVLAGAAAAASTAAQTLTSVRIHTGTFTRPVGMAVPPGDEDRVYVIEQHSGLVRIIENNAILPTPFLNVATRILTGSERGLLGIAFDPNYETNGYFYLSYTRTPDGASIVERFRRLTRYMADATSGVVGFGPIAQPFSNHNGGNIVFGPDSYLYLGLGDGGSGGDPQCNGQRTSTALGKILRMDTSTIPFGVPPSNPFVGNTAYNQYIWSLGWRNPWRFSFDRLTGDMFVGDVGQNTIEEVDFEPAGMGGRNYGWNVMEGRNCFSSACSTIPCNDARLTLPVYTYPTGADCSVVGGYVYRGCALNGHVGTYFFSDYCSGRTWSFRLVNGQVTQFTERTTELRPTSGGIGAISSWGEDTRGELYIIGLGGGVYRVVASDGGPGMDLGLGKVGGNGEIPSIELCGRLEPSMSAEFILRRAPASTAGVLLISSQRNDLPVFGGTLVPNPVEIFVGITTNGTGRTQFTIQGGVGPAVVYAQVALLDAGATFGLGMSNALRITLP